MHCFYIIVVLQSGEASGAHENGDAPDHEEGLRACYAARSSARPSNGELEATASASGHEREAGSREADGTSPEEQRLLGQQTLDFWMNLCLCHTLIVEEGEKGDPPIYQVPDVVPFSSPCAVRLCTSCHRLIGRLSEAVAVTQLFPLDRVRRLMKWRWWKEAACWGLNSWPGTELRSPSACKDMRHASLPPRPIPLSCHVQL